MNATQEGIRSMTLTWTWRFRESRDEAYTGMRPDDTKQTRWCAKKRTAALQKAESYIQLCTRQRMANVNGRRSERIEPK